MDQNEYLGEIDQISSLAQQLRDAVQYCFTVEAEHKTVLSAYRHGEVEASELKAAYDKFREASKARHAVEDALNAAAERARKSYSYDWMAHL